MINLIIILLKNIKYNCFLVRLTILTVPKVKVQPNFETWPRTMNWVRKKIGGKLGRKMELLRKIKW